MFEYEPAQQDNRELWPFHPRKGHATSPDNGGKCHMCRKQTVVTAIHHAMPRSGVRSETLYARTLGTDRHKNGKTPKSGVPSGSPNLDAGQVASLTRYMCDGSVLFVLSFRPSLPGLRLMGRKAIQGTQYGRNSCTSIMSYWENACASRFRMNRWGRRRGCEDYLRNSCMCGSRAFNHRRRIV